MKLEQLHYFLETAKEEHLGRASKRLHISPSAVSHSISLLEEELGYDLFKKIGKRIFLTEEGKLFSKKVGALILQVDHLKEEFKNPSQQLSGHYKIAATHLLCSQILMPVLCKFQKEHAEVSTEVFSVRSSQVLKGILEREYDLGVCFNPQQNVKISNQKIYSGKLLVCVNKNHPILSKKKQEQIKFLSLYPCVLPKAYQGIDVCEKHPIFDEFKINLKPQCLIDSYEVAIQKIILSDSWAFLPDILLKNYSEKIKPIFHPHTWNAEYFVSIISHQEHYLPKTLQLLSSKLSKSILKNRLNIDK